MHRLARHRRRHTLVRTTAGRFCFTSVSMETAQAPSSGASARFRVGAVLESVPTPCYVPPSIAGIVPHITPDNYAKLPELTTQVVDFTDICSVLASVKEKNGSLRDFLQLPCANAVLSARDYIRYSNPPSKKGAFLVATGKGRREVSPAELMEASALLRAQLLVPLADEVALTLGANRQRTAVTATLQWLDDCLAEKHASDAALVCGVVVGGTDERLRRLSAEETVKRDVQALLLSGLELMHTAAQRKNIIEVILDTIESTPGASSLPRFVTGIGHPLEVLEAVASGVDAFISTYPATATQNHSACIFWMDPSTDDTRVHAMERDRSGSVLHLREARFANDFTPLLVGCECYTCRHFTRAYVHHLLNVREMLGDTLLYVHNMHHYYRFFRTIRERIQDGSFLPFMETFVGNYAEKASDAPALAVPLAIAEKQEKKDAEKAERKEKKAALAAQAIARVKAQAITDAAKRAETVTVE